MIRINQISPHILEIAWPNQISEQILKEKSILRKAIMEEFSDVVKTYGAGYHQLDFYFHEPIDFPPIRKRIMDLYGSIPEKAKTSHKLWRLPVWYNGRDLESFAKAKSMSIEEVVKLHSETSYLVHFYGFLPGFLYLGGLDQRLATPRKSNPDRTVPAGSVAIGGAQTGIYPMESPGGWHLLGTTPVKMFDPEAEKPAWAAEGDRIIFEPIDEATFNEYLQKEKQGLKMEDYAG
jgi:KipI family sensor histidine kinase inhibitor